MATYSNTAREVEMPNGDVVVIHNAPTGGENTTSNIKKFKYDDNGHVTESTAADAEDLNLSGYSTPTTGITAIGTSDDLQTAIGKLDHQSHIDQTNILLVKEHTRRNLLAITDRTYTTGTNQRSADSSISPVSGKVVVSFGSLTSTDTDSSICGIGFSDSSGTTIASATIARGNNVSTTVDLGSSVATLFFMYPADNWTHSAKDSLTYANGMVIENELYDIDPSYQPYSAPNYDLTRLESEDRAELAELVDSGAKNLVDLSGTGTGTHNTVTFTNLGNNQYKINGTPSASDTHLDIMGTWYTVPSFLSSNVGKTIVFATNHDHIYYGIIPIVGDSALEYVGGNKSTPVAYTIPSNLSGALLRIYVDTNQTYNNVTAELLACTKAAFGVSSKFVPYRPNYDLVAMSVWKYTETAYTNTANDVYENTGIYFTVPKNRSVQFYAYDRKNAAYLDTIVVCDSQNNITSQSTTIVAMNSITSSDFTGSQYWTLQTTGINPTHNADVTYYVWVKRKSTGSNPVGLAYRFIS